MTAARHEPIDWAGQGHPRAEPPSSGRPDWKMIFLGVESWSLQSRILPGPGGRRYPDAGDCAAVRGRHVRYAADLAFGERRPAGARADRPLARALPLGEQ